MNRDFANKKGGCAGDMTVRRGFKSGPRHHDRSLAKVSKLRCPLFLKKQAWGVLTSHLNAVEAERDFILTVQDSSKVDLRCSFSDTQHVQKLRSDGKT